MATPVAQVAVPLLTVARATPVGQAPLHTANVNAFVVNVLEFICNFIVKSLAFADVAAFDAVTASQPSVVEALADAADVMLAVVAFDVCTVSVS